MMVALLSLLRPNASALLLAVLVAVIFTLLALSHLTVFTVRVAIALRPSPQGGRVLERREFITLLANHIRDPVSIDFFTAPTASLRVLFVFVVLAHHRRRVLHFNVTEHPTAAWAAQQIVDTFPDDPAPAYLLRDRDAIYGDSFRQRVRGMQIQGVLRAPRSPWQNPALHQNL